MVQRPRDHAFVTTTKPKTAAAARIGPGGQPLTMTRLVRAAGLRWPVDRHLVLVMAALAICAITAALLKDRTDTQAPPPIRPGQPPPTPRLPRSSSEWLLPY
jgi:hypothetical protein